MHGGHTAWSNAGLVYVEHGWVAKAETRKHVVYAAA
jgi:hypothetical protein